MARKRTPAWGSPAMQKAIRRHDRQFARKHGGPKPPRGGLCLFILAAMVGAPVVAAVAAVRGWA
jgi:hypothetical protein